jgi:hypothetical protein
MKTTIRRRTDIADCRFLVARHAEYEAKNIKNAAYRARRVLNMDELSRVKELNARAAQFRDDAGRHLLAAAICGNPVTIIKVR